MIFCAWVITSHHHTKGDSTRFSFLGQLLEAIASEGPLPIGAEAPSGIQDDVCMIGHEADRMMTNGPETAGESVLISSQVERLRPSCGVSEPVSVDSGADEGNGSEQEALSEMDDDEAGAYIRTAAEAHEKEAWWNEMFT